jgi:hypothetical protein
MNSEASSVRGGSVSQGNDLLFKLLSIYKRLVIPVLMECVQPAQEEGTPLQHSSPIRIQNLTFYSQWPYCHFLHKYLCRRTQYCWMCKVYQWHDGNSRLLWNMYQTTWQHIPVVINIIIVYRVWQFDSRTYLIIVIIQKPSTRDVQDYLEGPFIYMMCKFQLVWYMHMRITTVLVKSLLSSFQSGTKISN